MSTVIAQTKPHTSQSSGTWLTNHWFEIFLVVYGLWVLLPFLAPVLMNMGWSGAGHAVYFFYSFFCHQLPERSFFLYSLTEIQAVWQSTSDPMILRQFLGNETMGWKIAWSDRMISFYTSVWLFALILSPLRQKVRHLPLKGLVLFILPLSLDGVTHMLSDLAGIGQGFRDSNEWLVALTNNALSPSFYAGDGLGSFNSWMRLITGFLAGLGIVWFVFPYIFYVEFPKTHLNKLEES